MKKPRISIIAAVARNGVIGADQAMPWRLSTDLQRFKRLTLGHPVVMGRKTLEAMGRPLPGRTNVVISRTGVAGEGIAVASDVPSALEIAARAEGGGPEGEVFIIGGGQIYAAAMPYADRLYLTHVEAEPAGDTHFPVIDPAVWRPVSEERFPTGERDTAGTTYVIYDRRRPDTIG